MALSKGAPVRPSPSGNSQIPNTSHFLDLDRASLPKIRTLGWVSACPPDSPARLRKIDLDNPPPPPVKKTFIHDHVRTMDPCNHPNLFHHHGQFIGGNARMG